MEIIFDQWKTWTKSTKIGADKSAHNTTKDFDEKRLRWASVVRGFKHDLSLNH